MSMACLLKLSIDPMVLLASISLLKLSTPRSKLILSCKRSAMDSLIVRFSILKSFSFGSPLTMNGVFWFPIHAAPSAKVSMLCLPFLISPMFVGRPPFAAPFLRSAASINEVIAGASLSVPVGSFGRLAVMKRL